MQQSKMPEFMMNLMMNEEVAETPILTGALPRQPVLGNTKVVLPSRKRETPKIIDEKRQKQ